MKNTAVKIVEVNYEKIIFKTTYPWAFCLNASYEKKMKHYSLLNNFLSYQKLHKLIPQDDLLKFNENYKSENIPLFFNLRGYQKKDVDFFSKLKIAAIFSEMRTGKTPTALMIFSKWPVNNLLIIIPNILHQQWQKSVENWLTNPAFIITFLSKNQRHNFYRKLFQDEKLIIIVSKDTFKIDSIYFKKLKELRKDSKFYCVIIDEAHYLRNYKSQQSKSIYILRDSPYKIVLTGTPIVNHHTDIFGILKFLQPETYSSYWKFVEQYFYVHKTEFKKGKKTYKLFQIKSFKNDQLRQELQKQIAQFSVNRKQKEVLPWLPPIIHQKEYLFMEEEQQNIYSQWKEKWQKYQPLEVLAKLKTITLYPPALGFRILGSKINYLISLFKEQKEQKIIVFSTRSETFLEPLAQILEENGIEVGIITGKINYQLRENFISKFQKGELDILLCNIQSAGIGLNLSRAETIIFADRSYSLGDNEQAEARFLPTFSSKAPRVRLIIDLVCKGTIDEKILQLIKKKQNILKILDDNSSYFFS
ncbi:DEAD/DEAH box helicase [endosymbiont GvMRE of Glomus versiforme]|uniref:DEAD/DEAH box helicase n=1 Tax=endosymbiont GvMRE of Glomus versiforme TaxID=2039283 RepID=UPI000EBCA484|nr:DEAD/DEAH box helicase [endosymbiont GvMRE of Glomus versiforme]RHZ35529.1 Helicase SNF2 [endosymbiont GvMRE of Glomus versiforme]